MCRNYFGLEKYFDYIYVDARHNYDGVFEDLTDWFPKLKTSGLIAGHDYVTAYDVGNWQNWRQKWQINGDGSIDDTYRSVRGAVNDFFGLRHINVFRTGGDGPLSKFWSWIVDPTQQIDVAFHLLWLNNQSISNEQENELIRLEEEKETLVVIWTKKLMRNYFGSLIPVKNLKAHVNQKFPVDKWIEWWENQFVVVY